MPFAINVNGQAKDIHAFTLSAENYIPIREDEIQIDWRLDLGCTAIELNDFKSYFFTAGYLQPNRIRYSNLSEWRQTDPLIRMNYTDLKNKIILSALAPDLIICGISIFDQLGRQIKNDPAKIASSYFLKSIEISSYASGLYYVVIYYLPENFDTKIAANYLTTTLKLLKQ